MFALFVAVPSSAPPAPAPQPRTLEAGGCGWWQCSLGGELVPSSFVCATQCAGGFCTPVNICTNEKPTDFGL
jgi:hypothetical protein